MTTLLHLYDIVLLLLIPEEWNCILFKKKKLCTSCQSRFPNADVLWFFSIEFHTTPVEDFSNNFHKENVRHSKEMSHTSAIFNFDFVI